MADLLGNAKLNVQTGPIIISFKTFPARYTDTTSLHGRLLSGEVRNHKQAQDNKDSEEMFKEKVLSNSKWTMRRVLIILFPTRFSI